MLLALGLEVRQMSGRETVSAIAGGSLPELLVVSTGIQPLTASDVLAELSRLSPVATVPRIVVAERDDGASLFVVALERAGALVVRAPVEETRLLYVLRWIPGRLGALARVRIAQVRMQRTQALMANSQALVQDTASLVARSRPQGETKPDGEATLIVVP